MDEHIKKIFWDRKEKLIDLMENGDISIERQHQVYGAINEIENLIELMELIRNQKKAKNDQD